MADDEEATFIVLTGCCFRDVGCWNDGTESESIGVYFFARNVAFVPYQFWTTKHPGNNRNPGRARFPTINQLPWPFWFFFGGGGGVC